MEQEKYEIVKFVDNGFELEVNVSPSEETVWLTQEQIGILFETARSSISYHINNIFKNGELKRVLPSNFSTEVKPIVRVSITTLM